MLGLSAQARKHVEAKISKEDHAGSSCHTSRLLALEAVDLESVGNWRNFESQGKTPWVDEACADCPGENVKSIAFWGSWLSYSMLVTLPSSHRPPTLPVKPRS